MLLVEVTSSRGVRLSSLSVPPSPKRSFREAFLLLVLLAAELPVNVTNGYPFLYPELPDVAGIPKLVPKDFMNPRMLGIVAEMSDQASMAWRYKKLSVAEDSESFAFGNVVRLFRCSTDSKIIGSLKLKARMT